MRLTGCEQPWFELQLEYNRHVRACCYYNAPEDAWDEGDFHVATFWNAPRMQLKRRIVARGVAEGTGCHGCQYLRFGTAGRFTRPQQGLDARQQANWDRALANYEAKAIQVDSWPTKYYFNFGLACNFDCIHCSQTADRRTDRRQLPVEPLLAMKEYLVQAVELAIIGGEPFAVKNARRFIEAVVADPDYGNVLLTLYTNGSLLLPFLDRLRAMRKVAICVSLDGVGRAFETIRVGGRWDVVERNILGFRETGLRHGLDWRVNIAGVLMKTALAHLNDFVDWCIRHDLPVHFVPLQSQTLRGFDTDAEDVFSFPALLDEIPGWEDVFDEAIAKLTAKGWHAAAAQPLALMKAELVAKRDALRREERVTALRTRLGARLGRPAPVSLDELQAAAQTLDRLAKDPGTAGVVERGAALALLALYREQAAADGNAALLGAFDAIERALAGAAAGPAC